MFKKHLVVSIKNIDHFHLKGKYTKNALCILGMSKDTSWAEAMSNSEKSSPYP